MAPHLGQDTLTLFGDHGMRDSQPTSSHITLIRLISGLMITVLSGGFVLAETQTALNGTPVYTYRIIKVYPHDSGALTQGLEYRDGFLYESTGLAGRSTLRKVKLETGEVLQQVSLPGPYFGEGITILNSQIVQLTWQHNIGFVYDLIRFQQLRTFKYPGEGWGLANDGQQIFMTDGTAQIRLLNPITLEEKGRITVRDGRKPIAMLNELEYIRGEVFANVWQTDYIVRISPKNGRVLGWIDLRGLLPSAVPFEQIAVLNGIAYDAVGDRLFVTGKFWPWLFEIKLVPKPGGRTQ